MFVLLRAVVWSSLLTGFLLVFVPARLLSCFGPIPALRFGGQEIFGIVVTGVGAALAVWSVLAFVFVGQGTPAPFDPPKKLVVRGPYKYVRNPIYIGAGLTLIGAAIVYRSHLILDYVAVLFLVVHLLVVWYEEPTLRRLFGDAYLAYCQRVHRWWPRLHDGSSPAVGQ